MIVDLATVLVSAWLLYACNKHLLNTKCSRCTMSFMYVDYERELKADAGIPYSLHRYSDPFAKNPQVASCTPVIFAPGNQGSYKQSRTIGSWLANHYDESHCYTTYAVDFLEQWSVVSNKTIRQQAEFLLSCIQHVQSKHKNKKLVIVAHSMGGIVAKLALAKTHLDDVILITLATPQDKPALQVDPDLPINYESLPNAKLTINISGGYRDIQVLPFGTEVSDKRINLAIDTMPLVWTSPDHQSILWAQPIIEHLGRLIHLSIWKQQIKSGPL